MEWMAFPVPGSVESDANVSVKTEVVQSTMGDCAPMSSTGDDRAPTSSTCDDHAPVPTNALMANLLAAFDKICCRKHGGPDNYLRALLPDESSKEAFSKKIKYTLPLTEGVAFTPSPLPMTDGDRIGTNPASKVHVTTLGFDDRASCKTGLLDQHTARKLAAHILQDGFLTAAEPLVVEQPDWSLPGVTGNTTVPLFSLHYVKGFLRASTCLSLLHLALTDDIDLRTHYPKLWESVLVIHVHTVKPTDIVASALLNAKIAQRGSLRAANNMVVWAGVLTHLRSQGVTEPSTVIRRWNATSGLTQDAQLVGQKRTGVLNILNLDSKHLQIILVMVAGLGWLHCPFTEDVLASGRFRVGSTVRTGTMDLITYVHMFAHICTDKDSRANDGM